MSCGLDLLASHTYPVPQLSITCAGLTALCLLTGCSALNDLSFCRFIAGQTATQYVMSDSYSALSFDEQTTGLCAVKLTAAVRFAPPVTFICCAQAKASKSHEHFSQLQGFTSARPAEALRTHRI